MKLRISCLSPLVLAAATVFAQAPAVKKAPTPTAPAASTQASGAKSWKQLNFPKLGEIKLPAVKRYTLANGMKLFLVEDHTLPIIDGTAIVRAGARWVPGDKTGLAGIFRSVLRSGGTKTKTGAPINEAREP